MTCKEYQADLALAAAGCLDPDRSRQVTGHCRDCPECAGRLHEFQIIAQAQAEAAREIHTVEFHLTHLNKRANRASASNPALRLIWRWLVPVGAISALAIFMIFRQSPVPLPDLEQKSLAVASELRGTTADSSPTLAAYRSALKHPSESSLDNLLARHEQHLLPPTPDPELARTLRDF